uniref:Smr domain-containing protein n=2 Tax=Oryza punctata TaxID=4537 RepID=A0A0E0KQZ8_ORYPU
MGDMVTRNTVVAGYVMNRYPSKALELLQRLLFTGMAPDSVSLISLLDIWRYLLTTMNRLECLYQLKKRLVPDRRGPPESESATYPKRSRPAPPQRSKIPSSTHEPREESIFRSPESAVTRERLMDFRGTAGAAQTSEASKAPSSSRTSDLPPSTPWFRELWAVPTVNMYKQKIPNSGWAAFDRRWRSKDGRGDDTDVDSFPALSYYTAPSAASSSVAENSRPKAKPFASVLRPSVDFAADGNENGNKHFTGHMENANCGLKSVSENKIELLRGAHSWADSNLIEDVLASVNNDVGQASALLKAMASPCFPIREDGLPDQLSSEISKTHGLPSGNGTEENNHVNCSQLLPLPINISSVPIEPEVEGLDDDYLNHRKDALKMMRAATKHSQAASNAFMRGDHAAAKELSLRAQEERSTAEELNKKAAEEIFRLRNSNNSIWKLDMHGLHALEAVEVLERHLHRIEFQPPGNNAASTDEVARSEPTMSGPSIEPGPGKVVFVRPRQAILEVITGIGKHSKGQASLPVAVRGFLIENGYRFDELRPGVFSVRPKFRRR